MPHPVEAVSQTNDEFEDVKIFMYDTVLALKAKVVLETGTSLGNSTRIWAAALQQTGGSIWTMEVDAPATIFEETNIYPLHGDSLLLPWERSIDILFLDSDHRYAHVVKELTRFAPFVRPGGKIMLHDYLHEGTQPGSGRDIRRATEEWAHAHGIYIETFPLGAAIGSTPWGLGVITLPE